MNEIERLFTGTWLVVDRRGKWEFVRRPQSNSAVGILAINDEKKILLVEQFRIPMQQRVVELPAGIVGDEAEFATETLADCAKRELWEETGYHASIIEHLLESPTSSGMTSEQTYLFFAQNLTRQHLGGGVPGEDIAVHEVALSELRAWLKEKQKTGVSVDLKIYAALAAANVSF